MKRSATKSVPQQINDTHQVRDTKVKVPDFSEIESRWQRIWSENNTYTLDVSSVSKPYYNLMMFPYPSAEGLHVGNMYAFTGSDVFGRFKRLQGFDVFEPIGLDGFGIHSENFAMKIGRHPMDHAEITQKNYYNQLKKIGAMFDWSRTVQTYDTDYYRWTQWLFIQMFKHGLAYRDTAEVNWCPQCKTVLADEQVIDEKCERCGNIVEKRSLEQWFFRITAYAGKLLSNSFTLDWSEKVKVAQKNWIGKKEGINITYEVDGLLDLITVFTTAPVNFGMTFLVLAPEHEIVTKIIKGSIKVPKDIQLDVAAYVEQAVKKTPQDRIAEGKEKSGVFTGLYATNHITKQKVPIWITDFVLANVGTGAVQGCPGHDVRDFQFAKKYALPIPRVIVGADRYDGPIDTEDQVVVHGMKGHFINSDFLNGLEFEEGLQKTMEYFETQGWGKRVTNYHLRDWLISRQRYWGPPIPMIKCPACLAKGKGERQEMPGWYCQPESDLPVILPRIEDFRPGDDGIAPLAKHKEFYETKCPQCGGKAVRETDVSDTFLDSSWYFLRYPTLGLSDGNLPWDGEITKKWLPVDMYTGGAEHSVLHLMYSRFVTMALKEWGYIDFEEPFSKFYAHGLVIKDGAKMSKSKGNVVNPDEYINTYGADALRLYLMFMGPFDQGGDFRDTAMEGMSRWVGRIWRLGKSSATGKMRSSPKIIGSLQKLISKVTDDMEKRRYNTAIASMMEFTNLVADENGELGIDEFKALLLLLAPFAPHVTEELWQKVDSDDENRISKEFISIHTQSWPVAKKELLQEEPVVIAVQVNGKLRDTIEVSRETGSNQEEIVDLAKKSEKVSKHINGLVVKKIIFVPGKLLNFVVGV